MAGTVTAMRLQKRRRDRVNVYLDGAYAFSLQAILAAELRRGQALSDADIQALQARDAAESAYDAALRYLSYRPRSEQEIRRYLARREVGEEAAAEALARLQRQGFSDDSAFARFWVENREAFRPRGRYALRAELRLKGVEEQDIAAAVGELDEEKSAQRAAQGALRRLSRQDEPTFRRRMLAYLQRRGFGYDVARRVTESLWRELEAERATGE